MLEPLRDMSCSQHGTSACSRTANAGKQAGEEAIPGQQGPTQPVRVMMPAPRPAGVDQLRLDAGGRLQLLDARRDGRRVHAAVKHLLCVLRQQ